MATFNRPALTFKCDGCTRRFDTWKACKQHMTAIDHWIWPYECETCSTRAITYREIEKHMREEGHYSYPYGCETCRSAFRSENARDLHQQQYGHYKHLHCRDCGRYFKSANNLNQHMRSRIHQGVNVTCPFCRTGFTTASGVSHHLETGSCPSARGLNRENIYRELRRRDPNGAITGRLLEYPTERSLSASWDPVSAWNGHDGYECYLCHRVFSAPQGLRQHITSAVHATRLYHCPNSRGRCVKTFPSLAAMFNHLESESCGYIRFEAVGKNVDRFLMGRGLISI